MHKNTELHTVSNATETQKFQAGSKLPLDFSGIALCDKLFMKESVMIRRNGTHMLPTAIAVLQSWDISRSVSSHSSLSFTLVQGIGTKGIWFAGDDQFFFAWTFPRHPCGRIYNMSWAGIWMLWIWLLDVFALILIYTASSGSCLSGISILSSQPSPPCQQSCKENISYSTETRIGFSTWQQILCWWFFKRRSVRFKGPREADECRSGHLRRKTKEIIRSQGQGVE